jgi:hypothetical protein
LQEGIFNSIISIAANAFLLLGAFWLARDGFRLPRGIATALGTAVLFWASCTLGLEALGELGMITPIFMLAVSAVVACAGAIARWRRASTRAENRSVTTTEGSSISARLSIALLLAAGVHLGIRSLLLAVKVVSDGPIYHLYFAVRWWKAGRLLMIAAPFGENAATYFPANGDLFFTWLVASWGGDRLARVGQVPFLALAGLAAYGCARVLHAGRAASTIATCWFLSSTPLLIYSFEPNVDTIFVAGYMLATYFFLLGTRDEGNTPAITLGALAAGLALGTKPVSLVFVPPLLGWAVAAALRGNATGPVKLLRTASIVALPLLTGGYWYLRNLIVTGNPLYPLEVRFFSRTIWPGWYGTEAMRQSVYHIPVSNWRAFGDTLLAVLDPRLAPFWLAAVCLAWAPRGAKTGNTSRGVAILSLLAILNVLLYWICIPYRTQQRFMLHALGLAVPALARFFDYSKWLRGPATALLALHLLSPQTWPIAAREQAIPWDLTRLIPNAVDAPLPFVSRLEKALAGPEQGPAVAKLATLLAVTVAAFFATRGWEVFCRSADRSRRRLVLAFVGSGVLVLAGWLDLWEGGFARQFEFYPPFPDFYLGWRHLEGRSGPRGCRVAYAGTNLPYYLLGNNLRNEVRYVNVDEHRNWLMHDYHREALRRGEGTWPNPRPGWDRERPDYDAWIRNLEAEGIQLLAVTRANPSEGPHNIADSEGFPLERRWADSHPERFEPLYGQIEHDPWFRLYRFRRSNFFEGTRTDLRPAGHT